MIKLEKYLPTATILFIHFVCPYKWNQTLLITVSLIESKRSKGSFLEILNKIRFQIQF